MVSPPPPARRHAIDWDDGVASERTTLAWQRTGLSTVVVAVLVIRAGVVAGPLALAIPVASLLLAAAGGEWLLSRRIYVEHDRPPEEGAVLHEAHMAMLATVTVVAAASAAVLALGA